MAMEAAVAHAPPAPALRRSLSLNPTPAVRPDPKPWQGVLSARRQSSAVRCEPSRRPEARLPRAAATAGGADAAAGRRKRLAVFVSGGGSNFRAIHEAALGGAVHGDVVALVTDKPGCGGAEYARSNGIPVLVFPKSKSAPEGISVAQLLDTLRGYSVDFLLLAGYLKLIPPELIQEYPKSILNIHPSLLPAFGGTGFYGSKVHKAVIASGARYSGPTVHFVDEHYDTGKTLAQRVVPVFADDTPELLAARVLHEEHQVYVEAVAALCEDRIVWREDGVPIIKISGKKQVLISLSDKTDLAYLGNGLQGLGYSIVSTGGTASSLEAAGVSVTKVEEITHFPEMLDGRVKTLHPSIHGGILARRDQEHHLKALKDHGIGTFDVVVVNLYPFYDKVTSGNISFEDGIENIDIGGPAMIRAAAKNHKDVLIVVDHNDYPALLEYLKGNQEDQQFRRMLAWKAFQHVASYDSVVSEWFWKQSNKGYVSIGEMFPPTLTIPLQLKSKLRYGENPHQSAAFYADKSLSSVGAGGIGDPIQHHGKEMSYNNYLDADAAWNCVSEFDSPTCVVVKHTNPCGVASRQDIIEAYRLAVRGDAVSAFGGIVAFNTTIDEDLAKEIREFRSPTDGETRMFYEIVVAPGYTEKGLEILRGKSKTLRILEAKRSGKGMLSLRQVSGGWLAQMSDDLTPEDITFTTKSERSPQEYELADAKFAWLCAKHVKSNAIVIAKNNCMLGMGSGQPNRRESVRIAFRKAGEEAKGAALASDAFFPFAWNDAVEEACQNGIGIIVQPGGSKKDEDAIACCNKYGVSLVLTGVRHFKH